ncbi:MAG: ABC transporter substrate-binding protein [Ruminococcus sp.]
MKIKRKAISLVLVLIMALTVFAGCKSDAGAGNQGNSNGTGAKGKVYYLNFKPEQADEWEALAKDYSKESGVEVTVVTAASDEYETTLKSEIAKSEPPTLFQVNGPVGLKTWKDYCCDLRDTAVYKNLKSEEFALKDEKDRALAVAYVIETYGIIYNKTLLEQYCSTEGAKIKSADEIESFETLKEVAEDIQAKRDELGISGAFTSAGMDSSSDWRFKTHLANLPIYYEFKSRGITETEAIKGDYLDNYKAIWDLYINNATCEPTMLSSKTGEDATSEFALGEAVFYQNGTWAYGDIVGTGVLSDDDLGMLPIYVGVEGEENQGLCTGSENYWCINSKASQEDIDATKAFLEWVITSDRGREALSREMNFVTPFKTFTDEYKADNRLVDIADEYLEEGKTPVSWSFLAAPSIKWKNGVGAGLLEYAQGTGEWSAVEKAFVDGWAKEYEAANSR